MKAIKIIFGILLVMASLSNLLNIERMSKFQLLGYMAVTMFFLFIGAFLLYSGLKPKPPSLSISGEDQD